MHPYNWWLIWSTPIMSFGCQVLEFLHRHRALVLLAELKELADGFTVWSCWYYGPSTLQLYEEEIRWKNNLLWSFPPGSSRRRHMIPQWNSVAIVLFTGCYTFCYLVQILVGLSSTDSALMALPLCSTTMQYTELSFTTYNSYYNGTQDADAITYLTLANKLMHGGEPWGYYHIGQAVCRGSASTKVQHDFWIGNEHSRLLD